jgi:hypothetical protein
MSHLFYYYAEHCPFNFRNLPPLNSKKLEPPRTNAASKPGNLNSPNSLKAKISVSTNEGSAKSSPPMLNGDFLSMFSSIKDRRHSLLNSSMKSPYKSSHNISSPSSKNRIIAKYKSSRRHHKKYNLHSTLLSNSFDFKCTDGCIIKSMKMSHHEANKTQDLLRAPSISKPKSNMRDSYYFRRSAILDRSQKKGIISIIVTPKTIKL